MKPMMRPRPTFYYLTAGCTAVGRKGAVPLTPAELLATIVACCQAGGKVKVLSVTTAAVAGFYSRCGDQQMSRPPDVVVAMLPAPSSCDTAVYSLQEAGDAT